MAHYVYVAKCSDDSLYTGYTTDLEKRLAEHNGDGSTASARSSGAKYTRGRRPVKIIYSEKYDTRSKATQREYAIKQLRREKKFALVNDKSQ
ncbi:MAG: GIY-YIG nuclease family protein [Candidatus Pacebacteria bacterium]|nr:GIY-YIG nuclease family protein [Candidatus Paceibacterota bacterium]